jgi:glyoxylase-like metal-dependent hydrolase (beta-lactamase superfamily II)
MAKIFPLSEGVFTIGHDKEFVPFNLQTDELNARPTGALLVEVQPFLVQTKNDLLLLDTGLGLTQSDGLMQIHANIIKLGFSPYDITKVLLSHLHKDHAGGAVYKDAQGIWQTAFPNADYFIYRPEAEFALQQGPPAFPSHELQVLFSSPQMHWLDENEGIIDGYIKYTWSGAHSPYHIVFLITEGNEKIFYGGDEAPQLKQMKIKYVAKYDYDGKKAMSLRENWAIQGREAHWQFLFYHDVKNPVEYLR